jgi:hypothetical protein
MVEISSTIYVYKLGVVCMQIFTLFTCTVVTLFDENAGIWCLSVENNVTSTLMAEIFEKLEHFLLLIMKQKPVRTDTQNIFNPLKPKLM